MTFRSPEDALNSVGFNIPTVSGNNPAGLKQPTFSFVKKDFDTIGSVSRADALYRSGRFHELIKILKSNLSSNFVKYQGKVGAPHHRGQKKTDPYRPYTWLGFWEGEDRFGSLQFQVALSKWEMRIRTEGKQPEFSAGLWFEGKVKSKKLRMKMLEQFLKRKVECFQTLKKLPSEYVVLLQNRQKKIGAGMEYFSSHRERHRF